LGERRLLQPAQKKLQKTAVTSGESL